MVLIEGKKSIVLGALLGAGLAIVAGRRRRLGALVRPSPRVPAADEVEERMTEGLPEEQLGPPDSTLAGPSPGGATGP